MAVEQIVDEQAGRRGIAGIRRTGWSRPQHPDHEPEDSEPGGRPHNAVGRVIRGESMGPWIAGASLHVADLSDNIAGIVILVSRDPATASPWPRPSSPRSGQANGGRTSGSEPLCSRMSAGRLAELGWTTLTLAVTVGNPAQRLSGAGGIARGRPNAWRSSEISDRWGA